MSTPFTSRTTITTQTRRSNVRPGGELKIIQGQVGHSWSATTAGYTSVGSDAANRMLRAALDRALAPASVVGGPR